MAERFRRGEQFVEIAHAQQPGAAKRGIVNRIGAGQRAGMGQRRFGALRMAAGFDHQHRLAARRRTRRRHELARVFDRLDVEQDSAGAAVEGEMIEQVGEVDVDAVAERDNRREADVVRGRPFDQSGGDGARLRDER
ncbi:MAG TPA: hypothetical protein VFQ80_16480 [Thermomicrobiales bacterium]|nr:hypothetical protein [Thermomicrobiales bacterium]